MNFFKKRGISFSLIIVFLALSIFLFRGLRLDPHVIPSALINKEMPEFNLPELLSPTLRITSTQWIGKPALINVWASWCVNCLDEHAFLMNLAKKFSVIIYGLNYKDDENAAKAWLSKYGNPYRIIVMDKEGKTGIDWGVYGTPETFVIDRHGIIRFKQVGELTSSIWKTQIQPLLEKINAE